jgi:hypothetical protein
MPDELINMLPDMAFELAGYTMVFKSIIVALLARWIGLWQMA